MAKPIDPPGPPAIPLVCIPLGVSLVVRSNSRNGSNRINIFRPFADTRTTGGLRRQCLERLLATIL